MKQTIVIITDYVSFDESSVKTGCGGSETWAIEISKQFAKNGYHVIMFTLNPIWHFSENNIEYVPISQIDYVLSFTHVDYFIVSRYIFSITLNVINKYVNNNLYWIAHDTVICIDNKAITDENFNTFPILKNHLQKIVCMSDFGKALLQYIHHIPENYLEIIGNGLVIDTFNDLPVFERDNNLFWSSRYERGLQQLMDKIVPRLKQEIPDLKVYVAQYENKLPENLLNNPDLVFLGRLGKRELYEELSKHKVWFYPNSFPETFCISVLEAALCDNEIVMPYNFGPITTFKYFRHLLLPFKDISSDEQYDFVAREILNKIKNYSDINRIQIRQTIKNYITIEYNWENIYNQFKEKILVK